MSDNEQELKVFSRSFKDHVKRKISETITDLESKVNKIKLNALDHIFLVKNIASESISLFKMKENFPPEIMELAKEADIFVRYWYLLSHDVRDKTKRALVLISSQFR